MDLLLEPFAGLSGNMFLGLLLDLGGSMDYLLDNLNKVDFSGYEIKLDRVEKQGVSANYLEVLLDDPSHPDVHPDHNHDHDHSDHNHGHDHPDHNHDHNHIHDHHPGHSHHGPSRGLKEIQNLIHESRLSDQVKEDALAMFFILGKAEAKIHNKDLFEVHFHEVGAVDSLVDILGAAILMENLGLRGFKYTLANVGGGFVQCAHGLYPVPAPACLEILTQGRVAFQKGPVDKELLTPTGALILAYYGTYYEGPVRAKKVGYGAGSLDLDLPNVIRGSFIDQGQDQVLEISFNLDNMTGEDLGYFMDRALEEGALDISYSPLQMKKNRPGQGVRLLCKQEDLDRMEALIFQETKTLGFRYQVLNRRVLERNFTTFESSLGPVRVKKTDQGVSFEYEDLKALAKAKGLPLVQVRQLVEGDYYGQVLRR